MTKKTSDTNKVKNINLNSFHEEINDDAPLTPVAQENK